MDIKLVELKNYVKIEVQRLALVVEGLRREK